MRATGSPSPSPGAVPPRPAAPDDDGALDEDRMLGHRAQHLVVRRGVAEGERLELRLAATDDVDGADAEQMHDAAQLGDGQWIAQILADWQLHAGLTDERQR